MYRKLNSKERKIIETKLFQAVDDIMALLSNRRFKFTEDQITAVIKHAKRIEKNADAIDTLMVASWLQRNDIGGHDLVRAAAEMMIIKHETDSQLINEDI